MYRQYLRQRGVTSVDELSTMICSAGHENFSVTRHDVLSSRKVSGFLIDIDSCLAFFPEFGFNVPQDKSSLSHCRDVLAKHDCVYPPFIQRSLIEGFVRSLEASSESGSDPETVTSIFTSKMLSFDDIACLYVCCYSCNKDISSFKEHILESAYSYSAGWYKVAITSLLVCIEGVIRNIGVNLDEKYEGVVSLEKLHNIIVRVQKEIIHSLLPLATWVPIELKTVSFYDNFDERVQIVESLRSFVESKLYASTSKYSSSTKLNRHGVIHGLIDGFDSPVNYRRLLLVLNSLYYCSVISGRGGSLFLPSSTDASKDLLERLNRISIAGFVLN